MPVSTAAASLRLQSHRPPRGQLHPSHRPTPQVLGGLRRWTSPPRRELAPAARRFQRRQALHGAGRSAAWCAQAALGHVASGPTLAQCGLGTHPSDAFELHCASHIGAPCRIWGNVRSNRALQQRDRSRFDATPASSRSVGQAGVPPLLRLRAACAQMGPLARLALRGSLSWWR